MDCLKTSYVKPSAPGAFPSGALEITMLISLMVTDVLNQAEGDKSSTDG